MSDVIHYNNCPACGSENIFFVLSAKDETVSHEFFDIWECNSCTLRFTQDVPDEKHIARYYQSSDYISHSNTSKGFINKLYHSVRSFTLQSKRKLVEKYQHQREFTGYWCRHRSICNCHEKKWLECYCFRT